MNIRQLVYGVLSWFPFLPSERHNSVDAWPAEYSYSVWIRHLVLSAQGGLQGVPRVVAELGPGESIGVGIAALVSGVDRYLAFDAVPHVDARRTLMLFDRLVELFSIRADVPGTREIPEMTMALADGTFPRHLLSDAHLDKALATDRLAEIRADLEKGLESKRVSYKAPWDGVEGPEAESVDLILSQAVMEHVVNLERTYLAMRGWLRPGGFASHQIDFRSHGLFKAWDGHWFCPAWFWRILVGRRRYLINRLPFSSHLAAAAKAGLEVVLFEREESRPTLGKLAPEFVGMSERDRSTSGCYLLLRKT